VPAGGRAGYPEGGRCFFLGKAGKIAQLDRFHGREAVERLVQRQELFGRSLRLNLHVG
jgi:hypothetical protein